MKGQRRSHRLAVAWIAVLIAALLPVMEAAARGGGRGGGGGARGGGGFSRGGGAARMGGVPRGGGGFDRGSFQGSGARRPSGGVDRGSFDSRSFDRSRLPSGGSDRARADSLDRARGEAARDRASGLAEGDRRENAEQRVQERKDGLADRQQSAADRQQDRDQARTETREDWQEYGRELQENREDFWEDNYGWGWGPYTSTSSFWAGMVIGAAIVSLPPKTTTVIVGGVTYYYYNGVYYVKQGSGYVVVGAPPGAVVQVLPDASAPVHVEGAAPLEYANGAFYQKQPASADAQAARYEVVKPPAGVVVTELPVGAEEKTAGDVAYYTHDGTWYRPFYSGSSVVYMVVEAPSAG